MIRRSLPIASPNDSLITLSGRVAARISRVDAIDTVLGDQQRLGRELERALDRRIIRCDIWLADPAGEDHDVALVQVRLGTQADERLSDSRDRQSRHHPHLAITSCLEHAAEHQPVHHGSEDSDRIGLGALDPPVLCQRPAKEIPATDHNRDLHAVISHLENLIGDVLERASVKTERIRTGQRPAAELHDDASVAHPETDSLPARIPDTPRESCGLA